MVLLRQLSRFVVLAWVCVFSAAKGEGTRLVVDVPGEMAVAHQAQVVVRLLSSADHEMHGRITLKPTVENRAALFSTGGREAHFRIPANQTEATFEDGSLMVQSGSIAGEILLQATLDSEATHSEAIPAEAVIRIPSVAPVINANGISIRAVDNQPITLDTREFEVTVSGIAPGRELQTAEFRFRPSRPGGLERTDFPVDVSAQFRSFFEANPTRADFTLVMPFTVTGSLVDIASGSVTLVNQLGERSNEMAQDSDILR